MSHDSHSIAMRLKEEVSKNDFDRISVPYVISHAKSLSRHLMSDKNKHLMFDEKDLAKSRTGQFILDAILPEIYTDVKTKPYNQILVDDIDVHYFKSIVLAFSEGVLSAPIIKNEGEKS